RGIYQRKEVCRTSGWGGDCHADLNHRSLIIKYRLPYLAYRINPGHLSLSEFIQIYKFRRTTMQEIYIKNANGDLEKVVVSDQVAELLETFRREDAAEQRQLRRHIKHSGGAD